MAQQLQVEWRRCDFPHTEWPCALVEVNEQVVVPELVEFGRASTGQKCIIITFSDDSKLDVWLDPDFPALHARDYAVWKKSPFYNLALSTCPEWRRKCSRCQVRVEQWRPLDQIVVDLKFCERDDHRRLNATPHAHIVVRNCGFKQNRLGVDA